MRKGRGRHRPFCGEMRGSLGLHDKGQTRSPLSESECHKENTFLHHSFKSRFIHFGDKRQPIRERSRGMFPTQTKWGTFNHLTRPFLPEKPKLPSCPSVPGSAFPCFIPIGSRVLQFRSRRIGYGSSPALQFAVGYKMGLCGRPLGQPRWTSTLKSRRTASSATRPSASRP